MPGCGTLAGGERGHALAPPICTDASAQAQASGIIHLREATGYEVFPENPPGQVFSEI